MTRTVKRTMAAVGALAFTAAVAGSVAGEAGKRWREPGPTEVRATLVAPPLVPPPIDRKAPATVLVDLETAEEKGTLANGVEYTFWTFGGSVPGPMLRVRKGGTVRMRLRNSKGSVHMHSIDLHAVTGPGGGAAVTQIAPGEDATFEWKAINPGLYIYHCATPHIPVHVANGMYGAIIVEPASGLARVDREYYLAQGEFYTKERTGVPGHQPFDAGAAMLLSAGAFRHVPKALPMLSRSAEESRIARVALVSLPLAAVGAAALTVAVAFGVATHVATDAVRHLLTVGFLTSIVVAMSFRLVPALERVALPWPGLRRVAFAAIVGAVVLRTAQVFVPAGLLWLSPAVALSGALVWVALVAAAANLVGAIARSVS